MKRHYLFFIPVIISTLFIGTLILIKSRNLTSNYSEQVAGVKTESTKNNMQVTLKTTEGDIVIELKNDTPKTSQNFFEKFLQ